MRWSFTSISFLLFIVDFAFNRILILTLSGQSFGFVIKDILELR